MMLISHAVGLDQRRGEPAITSTPSVDTSAIIIEAGRIVQASGPCASIAASAVAKREMISKQNPIRASAVPFVGIRSCGSAAWGQGNEHLPMREPHISTLYGMDDVMSKHFGVTQKQALRTQALLRLGVTEEDVKIAERLLASRLVGDNAQSKAEWLLGYTKAEMSYHKALEVLGVSEAVVEEERCRRLGELGLSSWTSTASIGNAGHDTDDTCGGFFRWRGASNCDPLLGTTLSGDEAFASMNARVAQLEEVCQTQFSRIQQLEKELAILTATSAPRSDQ